MHLTKKKLNSGLTLVEVLVASSIILVAVVSLLAVHNLYLRVAFSNGNAVKAAYLAEEGLEAARFLRDSSWDSEVAALSLNIPYGLVFANGDWRATTTSMYVDNFSRTVTFSAVYRDNNRDIVSSGGTLDVNTLLVTSTVAWGSGTGTTTKSISTYLTNLYDN